MLMKTGALSEEDTVACKAAIFPNRRQEFKDRIIAFILLMRLSKEVILRNERVNRIKEPLGGAGGLLVQQYTLTVLVYLPGYL